MSDEVKLKTLLANQLMRGLKDVFGEYVNTLKSYVDESPIHSKAYNLLASDDYFSKEVEDVNFFDEDNILRQVKSKTIANDVISSNNYEFGENLQLTSWVQETPKLKVELDFNVVSNSESKTLYQTKTKETLYDTMGNSRTNMINDTYRKLSSKHKEDIVINKTIVSSNNTMVQSLFVNLHRTKPESDIFEGLETECGFDIIGALKSGLVSNVQYIEDPDGELICVNRSYKETNFENTSEYIIPTQKKYKGNMIVSYSNNKETFSKEIYGEDTNKFYISLSSNTTGAEDTTYGYNKDKFFDIENASLKASMGYVTTYKELQAGYVYRVYGETNKFSVNKFAFGTSKGKVRFNKSAFMNAVYRSNMCGMGWLVYNRLAFVSKESNNELETYEYDYDEYGIISECIHTREEDGTTFESIGLASYNRKDIDDTYEIVESITLASPFEDEESYFYQVIIGNKKLKRIEYSYSAIILPE